MTMLDVVRVRDATNMSKALMTEHWVSGTVPVLQRKNRGALTRIGTEWSAPMVDMRKA
jgi:hypothetical protein